MREKRDECVKGILVKKLHLSFHVPNRITFSVQNTNRLVTEGVKCKNPNTFKGVKCLSSYFEAATWKQVIV